MDASQHVLMEPGHLVQGGLRERAVDGRPVPLAAQVIQALHRGIDVPEQPPPLAAGQAGSPLFPKPAKRGQRQEGRSAAAPIAL
eukprot:14670241-Alexandrium_andersonii.AAC.1